MKILRIYLSLPPIKGGMEKHIRRLTEEQIRSGSFVKVAFNAGDKITTHDEMIMPILPLYKTKPHLLGVCIFYLSLSVKLLIRKQCFDIIHIHGDWSSLIFAGLIKKLTGARRIAFSIHGHIEDRITHQKFLPYFLKDIDLIFSTGQSTAKELDRLTGKEIVFQPSGVDDIFFSTSEKRGNNSFRIITIANLFPIKNIELILDIAKILKDVTFDIIGDGPERKRIENRIVVEKISNVTLLGFKHHNEIAHSLNGYDCFLLTSLSEGTPTAALEAMASGLAVVASDAGGLHGIVKDYENGFIVSTYSAKKYAEKIDALKSDPGLREKISVNNRHLSERYRWTTVSRNITDRMRMLLQRKIGVLYLITSLRDIGGAEKVLLDLAKGIDKTKFKIKVVSLSMQKNQLVPEFLKHGIETEILGMHKNIISFVRGIIRLGKVIKEKKIEMVHAHMFHSMLMAGMLRFLDPDIKVIFTPHNTNMVSLLRRLTTFLMKPFRDLDILFSEDMLSYFYKRRHDVIQNGISIDKYKVGNEKFDRFTFISVGRLEEAKNHVLLLDAAKELKEHNFQILIVGKGTLQEKLENLVRDYGIEDSVKLLGMRHNIPELLARSHAFVLPSLWEGLPISLLEAGASGLPVISTAVGSIPGILNDENGYLVIPEDFKNTMVHVMKHYDEALRKAILLRGIIEKKYSVEQMVKKHENLYLKLAG